MLLFIALIIKGIIIYYSYKNLNPRWNVVSYLASDIIIIFIAHLLVTINYWIKKRSLRLFNDFIVFVILIVYIVDIFTIFVFQSRVAIIDAFALGSNWSSWFDWVIKMWVSLFIITWFLTFFLVQSKMKFFGKSSRNMIIAFSICSFLYAIFYAIIIFFNILIYYNHNFFSFITKI